VQPQACSTRPDFTQFQLHARKLGAATEPLGLRLRLLAEDHHTVVHLGSSAGRCSVASGGKGGEGINASSGRRPSGAAGGPAAQVRRPEMGLVLADFAVKVPSSAAEPPLPCPRDQLLEALPRLRQELEAACSA